MKDSFQKLMQDLQPAVKQDLIQVYVTNKIQADIVFSIDSRKRRTALTLYIREHYDVEAYTPGSLIIYVRQKPFN